MGLFRYAHEEKPVISVSAKVIMVAFLVISTILPQALSQSSIGESIGEKVISLFEFLQRNSRGSIILLLFQVRYIGFIIEIAGALVAGIFAGLSIIPIVGGLFYAIAVIALIFSFAGIIIFDIGGLFSFFFAGLAGDIKYHALLLVFQIFMFVFNFVPQLIGMYGILLILLLLVAIFLQPLIYLFWGLFSIFMSMCLMALLVGIIGLIPMALNICFFLIRYKRAHEEPIETP